MRQSKSICEQRLEKGIVKSVKCTEENEVALIPGRVKAAVAKQRYEVIFLSESDGERGKTLSNPRATSLLYDYTLTTPSEISVPKLETKLKELCSAVQSPLSLSKEAAKIFSDTIELMDSSPEAFLKEAQEKIRRGEYCQKKKVLESLFLDAIYSSSNNGAIKVMVQEILEKKRVYQYSWALQSFSRVCHHSVGYIQPLFERAEELPNTVILAAGAAVGRYCSTEGKSVIGGCLRAEEVQQIMAVIADKLKNTAFSSSVRETKTAIALSKAIGNIKHIQSNLEQVIIEILEDSTRVPESVKSALLMSLESSSISKKVSLFHYDADIF